MFDRNRRNKNEILTSQEASDGVVSDKRKRTLGVKSTALVLAGGVVLGGGALAVNTIHKALPEKALALTGGHGTVTDYISSKAICPAAYRTIVEDVEAKLTTSIDLKGNFVTGKIAEKLSPDKDVKLKVAARAMTLERAAVDTELCQAATDVERVFDPKANVLTYNIPSDAIYTKSAINSLAIDESDSNGDGDRSESVYAFKPSGERFELAPQLIKGFMDNTGLGDESGFAKGLNKTDSLLLAMTNARAEQTAGQVCGPKVLEKGSDVYKQGFINNVKLGYVGDAEIIVNFVKDGEIATPTTTRMMDALNHKVDKAISAGKGLSSDNVDANNASCDLGKNFADQVDAAAPKPSEIESKSSTSPAGTKEQ